MASDKRAPRFRFGLELYKREARVRLATVTVEPDWFPALEWVRFQALRRSGAKVVELDEPTGYVKPVFDEQLGPPYVRKLIAVVEGGNQPPCESEIPLDYFDELARYASASLVSAGRLQAGELFEYRVCAYADSSPGLEDARRSKGAPGETLKQVEVASEPRRLCIQEAPLDHYLQTAVPEGVVVEDQLSVFIPAPVLQECAGQMQAAGAMETGGILLGHLRRDSTRGDMFLLVTAQIPALDAQQELSRLTFTDETWSAVEAAIELRGADELWVGWWHTHPADHWCRDCPPEKKDQCPVAGRGDYFSRLDARLHRTVFPRAYSVALVLGGSCHPGGPPRRRLFGWEQGMIASRGFYVLNDAPVSAITASSHQQERA